MCWCSVIYHMENIQLYSKSMVRMKNRENSVFSEIFYWQQRENFISISCSNQKFRISWPLSQVLRIEMHWESESEVMSSVLPSEYCLISCLVTAPYFQVTVSPSELPNWGYQWWQAEGCGEVIYVNKWNFLRVKFSGSGAALVQTW